MEHFYDLKNNYWKELKMLWQREIAHFDSTFAKVILLLQCFGADGKGITGNLICNIYFIHMICWIRLNFSSCSISLSFTMISVVNNVWAPGAQSVATWAVNAEVVSSNPSLANILSDFWQKWLWQASFVFHQWASSPCGKAASCLESMLCGVLVWENQETYE